MPCRMLLTACGMLAALLITAPAARGAEETDRDSRLRDYRLQLDWHPIGLVVPKGEFRFSGFLRMHPSGFIADDYSLYFQPTYGLGSGWEVSTGVAGAEREGPGGKAIFYALGLQKQLVSETGSRPAVSVGTYGLAGPHDHHSGTLFLSATKEVWKRAEGSQAAFLHGGFKYEQFDSEDYGSGSGVRPYVGATFVLHPRIFLSSEFSPPQPWERTNMYSVRLTYRVHKWFNIGGGLRNNGFETEPFISFIF